MAVVRRPGRCVVDITVPGARAVVTCCHRQYWIEGADYGMREHDACQRCVTGCCALGLRLRPVKETPPSALL